MYEHVDQIQSILDSAHKIVIIQADNPDADSLGSALALEHILADMGKEPYLYCGVETPGYLRYLNGWDRISSELPNQFDASLIVDASTMTLLERLVGNGYQGRVASKPCIVLDHHQTVDNQIPFATVTINDHTRASAGELIYLIAKQQNWPLSVAAQSFLMTSILGDTQGLTNQLASAETYRIMSEFITAGVNRQELEELRRESSKMPAMILQYKGNLLRRTEFSHQGQIVSVTIPQVEINEFSPFYNPGPLVQGDMLQTTDVKVAIVFKHYDDGKITAAIRCNNGAPIGGQLAEHFGGGGHDYASGFKINGGRPFNEVKSECLELAVDLLTNLETEKPHETVQHTF